MGRIHHAQKPSSDPLARPRRRIRHSHATPHNTIGANPYPARCLRNQPDAGSTQSFTAPLNPRRRPLGLPSIADAFPGQTCHRTTGHDPGTARRAPCHLTHRPRAASRAWHTRPETHQNLIHTDKDQQHGARMPPGQSARTPAFTELETFRDTTQGRMHHKA
jgi:hypothetical protein